MKSIWSSVSFIAPVSLEMLCLEDLSIVGSATLKSPSISVLLSNYFFTLVINWFKYLAATTFGAYILKIFKSSCWIDPLSMIECPSSSLTIVFGINFSLSDIRMATPAFF